MERKRHAQINNIGTTDDARPRRQQQGRQPNRAETVSSKVEKTVSSIFNIPM